MMLSGPIYRTRNLSPAAGGGRVEVRVPEDFSERGHKVRLRDNVLTRCYILAIFCGNRDFPVRLREKGRFPFLQTASHASGREQEC